MEETILCGTGSASCCGEALNPNGELSASINYHRYFDPVSEFNHLNHRASLVLARHACLPEVQADCGKDFLYEIKRFGYDRSLAGGRLAGMHVDRLPRRQALRPDETA